MAAAWCVACFADFRIAAPEARFTANFARLGFHHGFALTVTLPALVGQQKALELLYTGARINGDEAAKIGLVDHLVPLDDLRSEAIDFASEIATSAHCGGINSANHEGTFTSSG